MKFIRPIKNGIVTAGFDQMRPLEAPEHKHGAVDFGRKTPGILLQVGEPIFAPEEGSCLVFVAFRYNGNTGWNVTPRVHGRVFSWRNYFYDWAGIVLVLSTFCNKRTHIILHGQIEGHFRNLKYCHEEPGCVCMWSDIREVRAGDFIGEVGNAGKSEAPHIHWEVHAGYTWQTYGDRINPEEYLA